MDPICAYLGTNEMRPRCPQVYKQQYKLVLTCVEDITGLHRFTFSLNDRMTDEELISWPNAE